MDDNIYRVLGVQTREDCVSNALSYAFNQSPRFQRAFLEEICEKVGNKYDECHAYNRVSSGDGIPDIVIVCRAGQSADLVVIENKLRADEGKDQTERYSTSASVESLRQRLCPTCSVSPSFVFLTLFPDQEPQASNYITKQHRSFAAMYQDYMQSTCLAEVLVRDWMSLLVRFYQKGVVHPHDDMLEQLRDDEGLESGYLYFREAFSALSLPHQLEIVYFFRSSQQGRRYYGVQIAKEQWYPSEMSQANGQWTLNGDKDFYIHFEPQYDVINHVLKISLHYEVNPYQPESWVKSNIADSEYRSYLARRSRFTKNLESLLPQAWALSVGYNQIAKAALDIRGRTYGDVSADLERLFHEMTFAIDKALTAP